MKRNLFLLSLLAAFVLSACGSQNKQTEESVAGADSVSASSSDKKLNTAVQYIEQDDFRTVLFDYTSDKYVYLGSRPAVVDIYAVWCGPCKKLAPILEELAVEFDGQIDFYKFDAEQETDAAELIGVRAYPTLLLLAPGKEPYVQVGGMPKDELRELIRSKLL